MGKTPPSPDIETGAHKPPVPLPPLPLPPRPPFQPPVPQPWFAWFVPLILVANLVMFAVAMYVNDCPARSDNCLFFDALGRLSFQPLKENILLGPAIPTLTSLGALERTLVQKGQVWRLVSCLWLHAGLLHLVANMISLLCIGIRLEQEFGFLRIGLLYIISGLGGSLMSCLTDSRGTRISVGASGSLFGLLGAMLSELITNWSIYDNKCTALVTLVLIIALNLSVGFLPHVDNSAHFGGFIAGFFLGFVLLLRPQYGYVSRKYIPPGYDLKHKRSKYKYYQHVFWAISLVILIIVLALGFNKVLGGHTIDSMSLQDFT